MILQLYISQRYNSSTLKNQSNVVSCYIVEESYRCDIGVFQLYHNDITTISQRYDSSTLLVEEYISGRIISL